ncbi:MAG: MarR family transcriptional regulator [Proteobacteria bacterium]|nr:MarR family transcriptional regulator [Pseudomonadota bacterium]
MTFESRRQRLLAGKPQPLRDGVTAARALTHIAHLLEQHINAALLPCGVTMREYLALRLLSDSAHEPLRPTSLSVALHATRTQITRLLDALEKKGLIARTLDPVDRRGLQVAPTPAGAELLARAVPLVEAVYVRLWAPLAEADVHALAEQLTQVHAAFGAPAEPEAEDTPDRSV